MDTTVTTDSVTTENENVTGEVKAATTTQASVSSGEEVTSELDIGTKESVPKETGIVDGDGDDDGDGDGDGKINNNDDDDKSVASDQSKEAKTLPTEITALQVIHSEVLTNNTSQIGVGSVIYNQLSYAIKDEAETLCTLHYKTGDIFDCFDHPVLFLGTQIVVTTKVRSRLRLQISFYIDDIYRLIIGK